MRAPSPSFRAELAAFRKLIEQGPDDEHRALVLKILGRWEKRDDVEEVWESMGALLPLRPLAGVFIGAVIQSRRATEQFTQATKNFPQLKKDAAAYIEGEWNAAGGDFIRAGVAKELLTHADREIDDLLGRERDGAWKRRFVELWSDHFREHSGKPADKIVGVITEIAVGGEFTTTDVRNALKFRKRRDRDTRRVK
jgi:hypothetical protein